MNGKEEVDAYLTRFFKAIHDMKLIKNTFHMGLQHEVTHVAKETLSSVRRRRFLTAQDYNILTHVENTVYWLNYEYRTSRWQKWLDHYDKRTLKDAYTNLKNYYKEIHGIS